MASDKTEMEGRERKLYQRERKRRTVEQKSRWDGLGDGRAEKQDATEAPTFLEGTWGV